MQDENKVVVSDQYLINKQERDLDLFKNTLII